MSTQMSPDGMYYWDGKAWVSTLSYDGKSRWNGTAWVPVGGAMATPGYGTPTRTAREPTDWTRPMQYAVAGWYVLSALYSLTLPLWFGSVIPDAINRSFQQQQAVNPTVSPPPQDVIDAVTNFVSVAIWIGIVIGVAICVLFIVGALRRWTWVFYVVLMLLGLGVVSGPLDLVNVLVGPSRSAQGYALPSAYYIVGLIAWVPSTALFVWMLVAVIKRGPWAMRRVTPQ